MKLLLLLFLVGFSAASVYDALEDAAELMYQDFMLGMEEAGSLKEALGLSDSEFADETEDEIKTELGKKLRETLEHILEKIKESIEHGKGVREDLKVKLDEIKKKMKEFHVKVGEKAKELMQKLKDRVKEIIKEIFGKLGEASSKRAIMEQELEEALLDFNLKDMFKRLKKYLLGKIDKDKLKAKIEEIFGKGSEMADNLLELINKKGEKYKQKLIDFIDRYLGKDEEDSKDKRSLKEYWEKIKDYFKDLKIDLKEKYMKFGEWVKDVIDKGLKKSKDKMENIKNIAKEFIDHTKGVSKEVAVEALEFLKPYKEDLGALWDQVKETVKDIVNKRD